MGTKLTSMAIPHLLYLLLLSHLSMAQNFSYQPNCPQSFSCGNNTLQALKFPFSTILNPLCGLITVNCTNRTSPYIYFQWGRAFKLKGFSGDTVNVGDILLGYLIKAKSCDVFHNHTISNKPSISFSMFSQNLTLFRCVNNNDSSTRSRIGSVFHDYYNYSCSGFTMYYLYPVRNQFIQEYQSILEYCKIIQLPLSNGDKKNASDVFSLLGNEFLVRLRVSDECKKCRSKDGQCMDDRGKTVCVTNPAVSATGSNLKVILAIVITACVIIIMAILTIRYRKKWKDLSTYISTRNISLEPSSKSDVEGCSFFLGVPVFSFAELEEATDGFNTSKELGEGGFGTVYHGKLHDGREVAVKRLYENNFKRVTQFRNEIEILTRLRHKNLVTLYGCNSRQCRELLLVYEYIPNGTVADHLHNDPEKNKLLTWPIRLNIAIETASALAYLHKSDIIHRDVKTTNILLDNNFCVKVADFGLSRLFPNDATHVSTAPQGTPGYVDPEYYQCYQLTVKSDVYSFGVVLIELLSSMPAIDITRHRSEVNLANLAMNKIQNQSFKEMIDPSLGFESDPSTERMITSVAEVAFRCLQLEKEMRPSMDEVFDTLREIRDYKDDKNGKDTDMKQPCCSPEADHIVLLKTNEVPPHSPISVVDKWVSCSSSTSISSGLS